jgi:hypothetical protein
MFQKYYKDQDYDRANNPELLPNKDLMAIGVSWLADNNRIDLNFTNGGIAHPLLDLSGVAVVEQKIHRDTAAYVVNADGTTRFKLAFPAWVTSGGMFFDVYYVGNDLCFFFCANCGDFRMIVDPQDGKVIAIKESR